MKLKVYVVFFAIIIALTKCKHSEREIHDNLKNLGVSQFFQDEKVPLKIYNLNPGEEVIICLDYVTKTTYGIFIVNGYNLTDNNQDVAMLSSMDGKKYLKTWHSASRDFDPDVNFKLRLNNLINKKITVIIYSRISD